VTRFILSNIGGENMVSQEYQQIMVAIDGSKTAELAFKKAVNIVKRNNGNLIVVHIIDTRSLQSFPQFDRQSVSPNFMEQSTNAARNTLSDYKEWAKKQGLDDVRTIVKNGSPRRELTEVLPEEYDINLLILGATGLNAFERAFIGSVSQYVIREAPCDVLIVRTENDEIDSTPIAEDNNF